MPEFWSRPDSGAAAALAPLALVYDAVGLMRRALVTPARVAAPVICVGNATVGGAGKTPVAMALASWLSGQGRRPAFVTRGYRGRAPGPLRVDAARHDFREVGDEALLLAERAPCFVARDRAAGARAALAAGADCIVMDDGLQNPSLGKDVSLLVVDGGFGFGNGRLIPAGPLREPVGRALRQVQAAVILGRDEHGIAARLGGLPRLAARLVPDEAAQRLGGQPVVAFAGIGRPAKFFATLRALGCEIVAAESFPDHYPYRPDDVMRLVELASAAKAVAVTTEKDMVRLPAEARPMVRVCRVAVEWRDEAALARLLGPLLARPAAHG